MGVGSAIIAVAGILAEQSSAHQERKAAKSKAAGERKAAQEKLVADKEAKVAEQESVATGQTQGIDAANALKALGKSTQTGAGETVGTASTQTQELIGG